MQDCEWRITINIYCFWFITEYVSGCQVFVRFSCKREILKSSFLENLKYSYHGVDISGRKIIEEDTGQDFFAIFSKIRLIYFFLI